MLYDQRVTSGYYPQANGLYDRQIETIKEVLMRILIKISTEQLVIAQKLKVSIKDFFSKCDQIRSFLQIWSHLLNTSLMENFIF